MDDCLPVISRGAEKVDLTGGKEETAARECGFLVRPATGDPGAICDGSPQRRAGGMDFQTLNWEHPWGICLSVFC